MKRVYAAHAAQDFFVYGTPPARYEDLKMLCASDLKSSEF